MSLHTDVYLSITKLDDIVRQVCTYVYFMELMRNRTSEKRVLPIEKYGKIK